MICETFIDQTSYDNNIGSGRKYIVNDNIGGKNMLQTTTHILQGKTIEKYHGIVTGEAIMGANIVRDIFASVTDIVGGRSAAYENKLAQGRQIALNEMMERAKQLGANGVIGVDLDFETVREGMMMCIASGTAVTYRDGE